VRHPTVVIYVEAGVQAHVLYSSGWGASLRRGSMAAMKNRPECEMITDAPGTQHIGH